ncbi:hypothetical protein OAQ99_04875 [Candidatus Kapabacteria bacterium]|nr:hypothetical protein [Candidatus Kapabacteria bacterium]
MKLQKGNYFYSGIMFVVFAILIFSVAYYKYNKSNNLEYTSFGEKMNGEIVVTNPIDNYDFNYYLSIPFAMIQNRSLDLMYCKPTVRYIKPSGSENAFVSSFPILVNPSNNEIIILYSPISDNAIIYDTFNLYGIIIIFSIISSVLLILGLVCFKL